MSSQAIPYTYLDNVEAMVETIPPDTIVSRTVINEPQLKVIVFGFAPGQELSEHTSARRAIMHFLRGRARVVLGGDESTATAGTLVQMAPRLPHTVVAETETVMLLTMLGD